MSFAIGVRCSSASWPSRPAARASSANPRSRAIGRPRSASTAPQTPAPLSGSVRPRTCGWTRPMASISLGVRGSRTLWTGCPRPGTNFRSALARVTAARASASKPASSVGISPASASTASRNWPQSSVTPRNRDPPPSSPAASAPCTESGADRYVIRAAIAVGVKPWSASATRTDSKTRTSDWVGRRWVTIQNVSSPNPTLPIRSSARFWPSKVIVSASEVPSEVGYSWFIRSSLRGRLGRQRLRQPSPDLVAVLVQLRRRERVAGGGLGEGDRVPHGRPRAIAGPGRDDRLEPDLLRERDALVDRVDRPAGHADRDQLVEPVARGLGRELLRQQRLELGPVGGAPRVGREPRVGRQLGRPDHLAQLAELRVVAGCDDQLPVPGGQRLVREQTRV